jgi:ketosteroid isomerase-like protein
MASVIMSVGASSVLSGCASGQCASCTSIDTRSVAKELARIDASWSAAAATNDATKVAAFYADDAVIYPPGVPKVVGKKAAQDVWASLMTTPNFKLSWTCDDSGVSSCGGFGYTAGWYDLAMQGPDGTRIAERGKFLCLWKKQPDGTWKAYRDMWNADAM